MTATKTTRFDEILDSMRATLCDEYEASETLKSEFTCGADYAAFTLNTTAAKSLIRGWRADSENVDNMAAFHAADAAGRVHILGRV